MNRTPLYDMHVKLNGRMTDFGGWELPVRYTDILEEHEAVRTAAGLFDVSHMGEIWVVGRDALKFLQHMVTNDLSGMQDGQIKYSPMCYPEGGTVDDLLVYRYDPETYLLVVNAGNKDKDFEWLKQHRSGKVKVTDASDEYAQLALQGPVAGALMKKLCGNELEGLKYYRFLPEVKLGGIPAMISRTGYTGEDGFEIYLKPEAAPQLWEKLLELGRDEGLLPAGLGARDSLRFEAALPLYGHELSVNISPLEAGLGKFVKLDKEEFIGREALAKQHSEGVPRKLAGVEMIDRGIPRSGFEVQADGRLVGQITSGSFSPSTGRNVGMALVESAFAVEGRELEVMVRGKELKAVVVKLPFYNALIRK